MTIIESLKDQNLFSPFFTDDLSTWREWMVFLRVAYGLPIRRPKNRKLVLQCAGRDAETMPPGGFNSILALVGRRSGKSKIAAVIAAYEAALAGHEKKLSKGEVGIIPVISPTRRQSKIVRDYVRAIFDQTPILQNEVAAETREGFELRSGVRIEVLAGDFRSVRGYTMLACVIDEICFFGLDEESKIKSDSELIRAIRPSLATTGGKLVCISSPYAKRGWSYRTFKKHHGNDAGSTLVWNCPSRTMNPTLPQSVVDDALQEDRQAALAEYCGQFRDDVMAYCPREVVERLVVAGRTELQPRPDQKYFGFADLSGGRSDSATLAIAHREGRKVIVDFLREWRPPFSPQTVIGDMAVELKRFNLRNVTGDSYSAEFVVDAFRNHGIRYTKSRKSKNELFLELLPRIFSGEIELPDNERLVSQLSNLERRTRSGGRDVIDHPQGGHDDLSNVVAGVCDVAGQRKILLTAFS